MVSFHSAADLIQDFTSSKELLLRSIAKVKYGNTPRVLDDSTPQWTAGFRAAASGGSFYCSPPASKAPAVSMNAR